MKRFIAAAVSLAAVFFLLAFPQTSAHAQNWVDNGYPEGMEQATQHGDINSEGYVSKTADDLSRNGVRNILGPVPGVTVTGDVWQRNPAYAQQMLRHSAVSGVGNLIYAMYANPPADLALWVRDTGQTLGFIPKSAYAQGVGFAGLEPLLPLWKVFRNIAYLLLAFVMVIIGFMIMFRKKIDPKTVVTVQNALPKIIVTLILITFSYAIVGVVIDLMYVTILLSVVLIKSTGLLPDPDAISKLTGFNNMETVMSSGSLFMIWRSLFGVFGFNLVDLASDLIGWKWYWAIGGAVIGGILTLNPIGAIAGAGAALATPPLLALIIGIAVLFGFIRLFFMFLSSYINIILALLIGPIQLLGEAIPGSNTFSSWLKNLISNVIPFPIAAILFMISLVFSQAADTFSGTIWSPPFVSLPGGSASSVSALFAIGVLMVIPNVVNSIKEKLKAPSPVPVGLGGIFGPLGVGAGQAMTLGYQASFMASARRHKIQPSTSVGRLKEGGEKGFEGAIRE